LLKDSMRMEVAEAVRAVYRGARVVPTTVANKLVEYAPRVDLTERELEVLELLARGLSNKEIADAIGRSEATVKVHVLHILSKLGVGDRTGAVTVALKRGLIHLT
ncbi:MAG TPA: response regulator transcription factor, partial [Gemmatimonadaceae bacterium]